MDPAAVHREFAAGRVCGFGENVRVLEWISPLRCAAVLPPAAAGGAEAAELGAMLALVNIVTIGRSCYAVRAAWCADGSRSRL